MLIDDKPVLKYEKYFFYIIAASFCIPIPFLVYSNYLKEAIFYVFGIGALYILTDFRKYAIYILLSTIFLGIGVFYPLRLQVVNVFAYIYSFYFFINVKSDAFNKYKLPLSIKITAGIFIFAVFLSSINSPHLSDISIYFGYLFFTFIFTGYLFFRTLKNQNDIEKLLRFFVIATFANAVISIPQIIITMRIRSTGLTGFPYMDFTVIALLILLFGYYFMGKHKTIDNIFLIAIFFMLFASLSRFAWLGLLFGLSIGIFLTFKYSSEIRTFISNKLPVLIIILSIGLVIVIVSGIGNLIVGRMLEINFDFFSNIEQEGVISNSLESRIVIWFTALTAFMQYPVTGIGYFMFHIVSEDYNTLPYLVYEGLVKGLDAHSVFMNLLCETGLIGLISFYSFMINIIILSFKAIKLSKTNDQTRISIILSILAFYFTINSIYSGAYTFGQSAFSLYIFIGIIVVNYVILNENNRLENLVKNDLVSNKNTLK